VRARTDRNAVIVSMQHSGSLRYYAGRTTLQYMHFDPEWLDRAVAWFSEHGIHPYAVLENWEIPEFRARFGGSNVLGRLEMTPIMEYGEGHVFLYDLLRPPDAAGTPERIPEASVTAACRGPAPPPRLVPR
jgi:hypothetical protein